MTQKGCKAAAARTLMIWITEVCNRPANLNTQHDNVRKNLFDNLALDEEFISENLMGHHGDGQYKKFGVGPKMRDEYKLTSFFCDDGDPAHLIETANKKV